ncbi:hypothetical protein [Nostocoides japonicum]|uniref:hypothetical protein n=1 Tax=Nostocoides japonicum TaxID=99481 RepID=UPI000AB9E311|nr:hypothetical protein [Tetrasphaera japonica]
MNVYRRLRNPGPGDPTGWQFVGTTCNPESLPGAPISPPAPTFAQIQNAFRNLPFAKPAVHIQPEGNKTLVNLPTFYEARWPAAGLSAGEDSDPITLLGWTIEFRIEAYSYTYRYGDGTSSPATKDLGGTYPDGSIRHTYTRAGTVPVKVDARLTGQVRINGQTWEPVNTVVDLAGEPITQLRVATATNRLVTQ